MRCLKIKRQSILQCFTLLAGIFLLSACDDASMRITEDQFFIHEQGVAPHNGRNNMYPNTFNADLNDIRNNNCMPVSMDLAGFDFQMHYNKEEGPFADGMPDDDEQFFQAVDVWHESQANCNAPMTMREKSILEVFHRDRSYDVITSHDCNEMFFKTRIVGVAGLLDLDDLDSRTRGNIPNVRNGQNVELLVEQKRTYRVGTQPPPFTTRLNARMTQADLRRINDVRGRIEPDSTINWTLVYEYDGCNNPPAAFNTVCGKRHCWTLTWSDSKVQNATRTDNQNDDDRP